MSHTYFTGTWATGDTAHTWWYRFITGSIMLLSGFSNSGWKHHITSWWKSWLIPHHKTTGGSVDSFQGAGWSDRCDSLAVTTGSSAFKVMQPCNVQGGSQVICQVVRKQLATEASTFGSDRSLKGSYLSEREKNIVGQWWNGSGKLGLLARFLEDTARSPLQMKSSRPKAVFMWYTFWFSHWNQFLVLETNNWELRGWQDKTLIQYIMDVSTCFIRMLLNLSVKCPHSCAAFCQLRLHYDTYFTQEAVLVQYIKFENFFECQNVI